MRVISKELEKAIINWDGIITVQSSFLRESMRELNINLDFFDLKYYYPRSEVNNPQFFSYNYVGFEKLSKKKLIELISLICKKDLLYKLRTRKIFSNINIYFRKLDWDGKYYAYFYNVNIYTTSTYPIYDQKYKEKTVNEYRNIESAVSNCERNERIQAYNQYTEMNQQEFYKWKIKNYEEAGENYYLSTYNDDFLLYSESEIIEKYEEYLISQNKPINFSDFYENRTLDKWQLALKYCLYDQMSTKEIKVRLRLS